MIILRTKTYSRLEDEDYRDKMYEKKRGVKHAKATGALVGAGFGASLGGTLGSAAGGRGALIGAGIGGVAGGVGGYHLGRKEKDRVEKEVARKLDRYENANEKDRAYLRRKEEKDEEMALRKQQVAAQTQMAMNSYRW